MEAIKQLLYAGEVILIVGVALFVIFFSVASAIELASKLFG